MGVPGGRLSGEALDRWKESDFFRSAGMRGAAAAMNHRHVHDLLPNAGLGELNGAAFGRVLGGCWEARLRAAFPREVFMFETGEEIWFWQGPPPA